MNVFLYSFETVVDGTNTSLNNLCEFIFPLANELMSLLNDSKQQ